MVEFKAFEKIPRLNREIIITEKIDGTNACVVVTAVGEVYAQSRSRVITPEADNYGFAAWVRDNEQELRRLGPGYHYGEWWGRGINRNYGLAERRFSLFNVSRWSGDERPSVCHVTPVLGSGVGFADAAIARSLVLLQNQGSQAAPGFRRPEGVVIFHTASNHLYKITLENDEQPKNKDGLTRISRESQPQPVSGE